MGFLIESAPESDNITAVPCRQPVEKPQTGRPDGAARRNRAVPRVTGGTGLVLSQPLVHVGAVYLRILRGVQGTMGRWGGRK